MPSGGDFLVAQAQSDQPVHVDKQILAADAGPFDNVVAVLTTTHQIFIQKITLSIYTHAAQTITFVDDAATPVKIAARLDAASAAGVPDVIVWDFGPHGTALTLGKNLDITLSAAGIGARVHIEGYQK